MSLKIAQVQFQAPTSTGNQSITTSKCGGLTPKAVIFIGSGALYNDTIRSNTVWSFGCAVSTSKRFCFGAFSNNNDAPTAQSNMRYKSEAGCAVSFKGSVDGIADLVSFDTNGCTINWSNAPDSAYLFYAIFFCGTDLSVDISTVTVNSSVNGTATESGLSFQPDVLIPFISGFTQWNTGADYWNMIGLGLVKNGGNKNALLANAPFYDSSCKSKGRLTTSYGAGFSNYQSNGDVRVGFEFGSFGSSGFTVTTRLNGCDATTSLKTLCLKFGTYSSYVGTFSSKTSTGTQAYTGIGFKPQAILGWFTSMTAIDSSDTGHGHSYFCADNNKDISCHGWGSGDMGASNSVENSLATASISCLRADLGTKIVDATMTSYDSDGFTLNYGTADSTARYGTYLAIQEETAVVTALEQRAIGRGIGRGISRGIG